MARAKAKGGAPKRKAVEAQPAAGRAIQKTPSGIPGLDDLIEGGLEPKSVIILSGGPGTGKSTFGLQFLYNGALDAGENGIYITFEEQRESVFRHMGEYGWDLEKLEKERKFVFLAYPPHEVERFIAEGGIIEDMIEEHNIKRIVIDSITSFLMMHEDEYKRREAFLKLMDTLRKWGCTTLLISEGEVGPDGELHTHFDIEFISDGLIDLRRIHHEEVAEVQLEVVKMRGIAHTRMAVPLKFTGSGVAVAAPPRAARKR